MQALMRTVLLLHVL